MARRLLIPFSCIALSIAVSISARAVSYRIVDLGTFGGISASASSVNSSGQIVGSFTNSTGEKHAFLYTPSSGMTDLGTFGGLEAEARDINDSGQIAINVRMQSVSRTYIRDTIGSLIDVGSLGGGSASSQAINNLGQVVGNSGDFAFLYTPGSGMANILPAYPSYAVDISDTGYIAGGFLSGGPGAFVRSPDGTLSFLHFEPIGDNSYSVYAVNAAGVGVGRHRWYDKLQGLSVWEGMIWPPPSGTGIHLPSNSYHTSPADINDDGWIVGHSTHIAGSDYAFLTGPGIGTVELPTLGGVAPHPLHIDNTGMIAGYAQTASGETHAVYWEQVVPEPSGILCLSAGGLGLLLAFRRRKT